MEDVPQTMADLILGVDGGQSSTIAVLVNTDGTVLGVGQGGPSNHIHEPGGIERMSRALREAVFSALQVADAEPIQISSACFGMTGGVEYVPEIAQAFLPVSRVVAYHDVHTALIGASRNNAGVIVISGTGAIAYGRTPDGRESRADGMGYLMGDEGSAYWIGLQALRAVARAQDGRGASTYLQEDLLLALNLPDFSHLHQALYSQTITRPAIATLARQVYCTAKAGDSIAQEILVQAGRCLAWSAATVLRRLESTTPLNVYTSGGVFRAGGWVLDTFSKELHEVFSQQQIRPPAYPQVVGAILGAYQQAYNELPPLHFFAQLEKTMPVGLLDKSDDKPCPRRYTT